MPDVKAIFLAAAEKATPAERAAYLDAVCAGDQVVRQRVEALLRAHDEPGDPAGTSADASEPPGTVIAGRYKLLEEIGEGGMGTVWMAEQTEPVRRLVALKLVKPGMDSRAVLARFEAERQALAMMDHPNIAKVLDGGTIGEPGSVSAGRPFFVMELVKGVPITTYCDDRSLTVRQRLELFALVCAATQHAHQKGVIHRDLKPSNILVTEHDGKPVPKVIDFGLAKALLGGPHALTEKTLYTAFGTVVGTPLYMAPEQVALNALDVDTRADVYALGVLLYELLTGSTPLEKKRLAAAAWDKIRRMIREEEPPRPSTRLSTADALPSIAARRQVEPAKLGKLIRGELDWIVMRALEKDRNRRYETTNAFARDVQRYLADEPVEACPPSAWYRVRKFGRKHKAGLATAAGFVGLVFAAAMVASWLAVKAHRAEAIAEAKTDEAKQNEANAISARDETEVTLARSLGRPFLEKGGDLTEPEAGALWELARNPGEKLWFRFVEEATRTPLATAQLSGRAESACIAAVGLDPVKRERAERLFGERLHDPNVSVHHKIDLSFVAIELAAADSALGQQCSEVLATALTRTSNDKTRDIWRGRLIERQERLDPRVAAKLLADDLRREPDAQVRIKLAEGLAVVAGRLDPEDAGRILIDALRREPNDLVRRDIASGLAAAVGNFEPPDAARILTDALSLESLGVSARVSLAEGLAAVAGRLDPADAARTCTSEARLLADALTRSANSGDRMLLAEGLTAVAAHLDPADAVRLLADALAQNNLAVTSRWRLAKGLAAVAGRLDPADAARICTPGAHLLADALTQSATSHKRMYLAEGLAAVAARLDPTDAAKACAPAARLLADNLGRKHLDGDHPGELAEGLAFLADRLDPAEAARMRGLAARVLADALVQKDWRETDWDYLAYRLAAVAGRLDPADAARMLVDALGLKNLNGYEAVSLADGLAAMAGRLDPADAAQFGRRSIQLIREALKDERHIDSKPGHYHALASIIALIDPDQARQIAREVTREIASHIVPRGSASTELGHTVYAVDRLLFTTTLVQLRQGAMSVVSVTGGMGFGTITTIPLVTAATEPLPSRLTTQELVELLKMPTCYGELRKVILKHLGNRYGRVFRDHWEFVEYAREKKLDLDFTSPPVRYRAPEPAAR
jgi:serine/threonine protein kinase